MGHYFQFTWPHPAGDVFVTGTFDEWKGSVKLQKDKDSGQFSAVVDLGEAEKTFYKYIVDGNWTVNDQEHKEKDPSGIENNVLFKSELMSTPPAAETEKAPETAFVQSAAPDSTTTALAANVPHEKENIFTSSVAPNSTTAELAAKVPYVKDEIAKDDAGNDEVDGKPTPGLGDVPGGFPETPATEQEATYSISPLPAVRTAGNPISLAPGEPVPTVITESVNDTVHLDKESYEKADASNLGVGSEAPVLPPVVTPAEERAEKGTGVLDVPLVTSPIIPESSPDATVPEIVRESQEKAQVDREANVAPEAVVAKKELEKEIESVVAPVPPISEGPTALDTATETAQQAKATIESAVASGAAIVSEQAAVATDKAKELTTTVTETVAQKVDAIVGTKDEETLLPTVEPPKEEAAAPSVPEVVKESQGAVHVPPEAAASEELVHKKADVEHELITHPPHLHHTEQRKTETPEDKSATTFAPVVLAANADVPSAGQPTIRAVQPETAAESTPPVINGTSLSSSPKALNTPIAPATTETFTTPVTAYTSNSSTDSAKSDDETKEQVTSEKASEKKREKRISGLFSRLRNMFK